MIGYRDATMADGAELDAMARESWLATFAHSAPPDDIAAYVAEAYGPAGKLRRDLADPAVTFRVATHAGAIIGYAKLTAPFVEAALAADAQQLSQLYVAADWHGRGIADALLDWSCATSRARGAAALILTVWEENARARRFYEKKGFVHIGHYAFRTGNQVDHDLVMRLAL